MTRTIHRLLLPLLVLVASCRCSRPSSQPTPSWPSQPASCATPTVPDGAWRHTRSELVARAGDARHVADDLVVAAGTRPALRGKFSYGAISKDLEDETVEVFVSTDGCATRRAGTTRTDDDGRAGFEGWALAAGFHRYWMVAAGDGTSAEGGVWAVSGATPAVLFDVDGTLTTDDGELFEDLVGRGAAARPGAAAVARAWADKGYLIVYITGRPYLLRGMTRRWLAAGGFPFGPLFTPDRMRSALPDTDGVGAFKLATLRALAPTGLRIVRAYGNAATDVCAYAQAGISPDATYIAGSTRPSPCTGFAAPRGLPTYEGHEADVAAQPAAVP